MALLRDGEMIFYSTPTVERSWVSEIFSSSRALSGELYPYQRGMADALFKPPGKPKDSLCLRLPWGEDRNFLVPARDPSNPVFETTPRGALNSAIREALTYGTAVVSIDHCLKEISIRAVDYECFCAVSVQEKE